jgi:hypothetical protein
MRVPVAIAGRGEFFALITRLMQNVYQQPGCPRVDLRNRRNFVQMVLGVVVKQTTRLKDLAQFIVPRRAALSVKAVAVGLGYFLAKSSLPARQISTRVLLATLREVDPAQLECYRGKVILVIDPTEYPKRSRGKGKLGRNMEHIGRVRKKKGKKGKAKKLGKAGTKEKLAMAKEAVATTTGYVDVWAGIVLRGKQFLPLARRLYSSQNPRQRSQNRVEKGVLFRALGMLKGLGLAAIAVGDRGLGRKELMIRLAKRGQDIVFRIDGDINAQLDGAEDEELLAKLLTKQDWLGEAEWDRGEEGKLPCRVRKLVASIRFSRSGRKDDYEQARLNFIELVPVDEAVESLLLATTLPADTLSDARGIARVYSLRWSVETGFETMKAWGLARFMVRKWQAIDRLLWIVAVAYALMVAAHRLARLAKLRQQALEVIKKASVLGRTLTVGKLAEALGLDCLHHCRAWANARIL